ncbi:hypothetical protein J7M23_01155 [Candidatus Sumerlaeota bacterium]|nr:hypothetical protein [Candidatus Sumerlaeota bacterium]
MRVIKYTVYLMGVVVFLLPLLGSITGVEQQGKTEDKEATESSKKIITPGELKKARGLLNEFQSITEKVRQIEKEKIELLGRLGRLKKELSGTNYLRDRILKSRIEKIITTLHTKIVKSRELEEKQSALLEKIAQDKDIRRIIQQRINTISERLEKLKTTPETHRDKIEQAQKELKKWQDLKNVVETVETYGTEEVLAIINRPQKMTPIQEEGEKEIFPRKGRPSKFRQPFLVGRLQWRLKRMEEEIRFLRQQIEQLDREIKHIRSALGEETITPHHPSLPVEKSQFPPPGDEIHPVERP